MSFSLPTEVSKHLFNDGVCDYMSGKTELAKQLLLLTWTWAIL